MMRAVIDRRSFIKKPLQFNPLEETFIDEPEANTFLSKAYRSPYVLPEVV
jgi:hypothetical protein